MRFVLILNYKHVRTAGLRVYLQSINSDKHLPQSPFTGQFLKMTSFCIDSYLSYLSTGTALQRQNAENLKQIFPEKEYRGLSPNFHIHASVSELYIPMMGLPVLLEEICRLILGIYKSIKDI
jgi:hypothetical protein